MLGAALGTGLAILIQFVPIIIGIIIIIAIIWIVVATSNYTNKKSTANTKIW